MAMSSDEDESLSRLAPPPGVQLLRRPASSDAAPGSLAASSLFGAGSAPRPLSATKKAASDAVGTLLGFLQQEEEGLLTRTAPAAAVSNPPRVATSSAATSRAPPLATTSSSAAPRGAPATATAGTPTSSLLREPGDEATPAMSSSRQPAIELSPAAVAGGAGIAGRGGSWDLGDLLPDLGGNPIGTPTPPPGPFTPTGGLAGTPAATSPLAGEGRPRHMAAGTGERAGALGGTIGGLLQQGTGTYANPATTGTTEAGGAASSLMGSGQAGAGALTSPLLKASGNPVAGRRLTGAAAVDPAAAVQSNTPSAAMAALAGLLGSSGGALQPVPTTTVAVPITATPSVLNTPSDSRRWDAAPQQGVTQQQTAEPSGLGLSQLGSRSQQAASAAAAVEGQAAALREVAALRAELEQLRVSEARARRALEESKADHTREIARLQSEAAMARREHEEAMARAAEVAAREAEVAAERARREALLERDVAVAQVKAQSAALAAERDALTDERARAEELTTLVEEVRRAAGATGEREARALAALERGSAERGAAVEQRLQAVAEREAAVAARERQLDELKAELARLAAALEARAAHDREALGAQGLRVAKDAARVEALQAALLAEREEARAAAAAERQAVEDARAQRTKERESFLSELSAERRRLAEDNAAAARAAEEARSHLLDLKGRVADYEAAAAAALRQARDEETRAAAAKEDGRREREAAAAALREVKDARVKLEEDRALLSEWGERLRALTADFDKARVEIRSAREEIETQRGALVGDAAAVATARAAADAEAAVVSDARLALDRERVAIARERAALSRDRVAASRAAGLARDQQQGTAIISPTHGLSSAPTGQPHTSSHHYCFYSPASAMAAPIVSSSGAVVGGCAVAGSPASGALHCCPHTHATAVGCDACGDRDAGGRDSRSHRKESPSVAGSSAKSMRRRGASAVRADSNLIGWMSSKEERAAVVRAQQEFLAQLAAVSPSSAHHSSGPPQRLPAATAGPSPSSPLLEAARAAMAAAAAPPAAIPSSSPGRREGIAGGGMRGSSAAAVQRWPHHREMTEGQQQQQQQLGGLGTAALPRHKPPRRHGANARRANAAVDGSGNHHRSSSRRDYWGAAAVITSSMQSYGAGSGSTRSGAAAPSSTDLDKVVPLSPSTSDEASDWDPSGSRGAIGGAEKVQGRSGQQREQELVGRRGEERSVGSNGAGSSSSGDDDAEQLPTRRELPLTSPPADADSQDRGTMRGGGRGPAAAGGLPGAGRRQRVGGGLRLSETSDCVGC